MNKGERIAGRYIILKNLGHDTYLAENAHSGVRWIMKAMPHLKDPHLIELLRKMRHPTLPRIFEEIQWEGNSFYILEYIEGETLADLLEKNQGKMESIRACHYISQVARTLYFLHTQPDQTILHLDIKPSNILLTPDQKCCLLDYGSMHLIRRGTGCSEELESKMQITCTLAYAPPEVIKGEEFCVQSDIYMAGVTLLRLISGKEREYALDIDFGNELKDVPTTVSRIIRKCTMNQPSDRYSNAGELAADLENCCETTLSVDACPFSEYHPIELLDSRNNTAIISSDTRIESDHKLPPSSLKVKKIGEKKVICVWDQAQFAVEMGYVLAKQGRSVLLVDANLLSPEIDLLIDLYDEKKEKNPIHSSGNCLSDLMEENVKNRLNPDTMKVFARKCKTENLFCICGDYRMEDYEYYSTEGFVNIIRTASVSFDYIILSCSKFIYDEFTCVSLICADILLIPIIANSIYFREFNRYIHFMSGRKQLNLHKLYFVGYEYQSGEDFSYGMCDELCSGRFIGSISYSQRRRMMQGSSKTYISAMESKIEKQYLHIIRKMDIG
jgi:serine/threonine protein kinase